MDNFEDPFYNDYMFWNKMGKRFIFIASLCAVLVCPAYSIDYENYQAQKRLSVQEEFGDYMTSVRSKIMKTWTPPDVLEEGHATIVFKLSNDGNVISFYIKESSGNKLYDESAINSIEQAAPFNQFPENTTRSYISIQYSFDSSIVKADSIKELVKQSEKYINTDNSLALKYIDKAIAEIEGDPAAYFLYARRHKINNLLGNFDDATKDLAECQRLKKIYDKKRINKCKEALMQEETPFAYFTLANAYDLAGDYTNAIASIDKAISMTELNQAYKRYRAEIEMRNSH